MSLIETIQLINAEGLGPVTFYRLVGKHGSASNALKNLPPKFSPWSIERAEEELKKASALGAKIISYQDKSYPQKLKALEDAPPLLYVLGNEKLLNHEPALSIVGARNASVNGRKTASKIAYDLTNNNVLIISGLARGIDSAAHKGAMYAKDQAGPTLAVLGCGIDIVYPLENQDLYKQIIHQGVLVSEFPLGYEPQTANFPRRNRIVSALSEGTLVVEANLKSGSLITAKRALEQKKKVFAIPGSPQDARSLGPNKLIKEGAHLVENAQDIFNILCDGKKIKIKQSLDKPIKNNHIPQSNFSDLISFLSPQGLDIDELIRVSGLSAQEVNIELLELELEGKIERQAGNKVALLRK